MRTYWLLSIGLAALEAAEPRTIAEIRNPYGVIEGPDGAVYVCSIDDHRIFRVDRQTGRAEVVVDGQFEPYEIRFDRDGHLYFVDMKAHVVKRMDARTRALSIVAGTGTPGFSGDGGRATEAQLNQPHAIQFDPQGRLLICDIRNHRVRRVDLKTGQIETVLGGEGSTLRGPRAIDFAADGTMWLALREGNAVLRLPPGPLSEARLEQVAGPLHGPKGIAVAPDGGIWIADTESHEVSRIDPKSGTVRVIAAGLKRPHGIYVTSKGEVLVGDSENHRVLSMNAN